uniref:Cyclic nucleotide-binding domain-containing protein n=1 Tax=Mesocestoides corti TaxID=53468 RepID=A0A5K3G5V8_MESCO
MSPPRRALYRHQYGCRLSFRYTGYQQQCNEPSQKLRTGSLLRGRHARKISSQPEKDTIEVQYIMSGLASVADSDGRRLTRGSGL